MAIKGCEEILYDACHPFDFIACAIGTAGTIAGLIESSQPHQHILGFPSLKGDFIQKEVEKLIEISQKFENVIIVFGLNGFG